MNDNRIIISGEGKKRWLPERGFEICGGYLALRDMAEQILRKVGKRSSKKGRGYGWITIRPMCFPSSPTNTEPSEWVDEEEPEEKAPRPENCPFCRGPHALREHFGKRPPAEGDA